MPYGSAATKIRIKMNPIILNTFIPFLNDNTPKTAPTIVNTKVKHDNMIIGIIPIGAYADNTISMPVIIIAVIPIMNVLRARIGLFLNFPSFLFGSVGS